VVGVVAGPAVDDVRERGVAQVGVPDRSSRRVSSWRILADGVATTDSTPSSRSSRPLVGVTKSGK